MGYGSDNAPGLQPSAFELIKQGLEEAIEIHENAAVGGSFTSITEEEALAHYRLQTIRLRKSLDTADEEVLNYQRKWVSMHEELGAMRKLSDMHRSAIKALKNQLSARDTEITELIVKMSELQDTDAYLSPRQLNDECHRLRDEHVKAQLEIKDMKTNKA